MKEGGVGVAASDTRDGAAVGVAEIVPDTLAVAVPASAAVLTTLIL